MRSKVKNPVKETINIFLVDDHKLFRNAIAQYISNLSNSFFVSQQFNNGVELLEYLASEPKVLPDIILLDINMPEMGGVETAKLLKQKYPDLRVIILTMNDGEAVLIKMLSLGVKGFLSKDVEPDELKKALEDTHTKGYYYSEEVTGILMENAFQPKSVIEVSKTELTFLELACSELTYYQIADKMFLSPKTIEGYRNNLFERFQVKNRVGLVLFAIKNGLVSI
jgi:DNA-binding NarL/FixJ family response regulator